MMRILMAIDGSEPSLTAVAALRSLAIPAGSTIELLCVLPDTTEIYAGTWPAVLLAQDPAIRAQAAEDVSRLLEDVADGLVANDVTIHTRTRHGRPASEILHAATSMPADLIVLGARGHRAIERLFVGSVSSEVVDHAPCPVLVVRTARTGRILLATDGSADAAVACDFVARCGLFRTPDIRVLSVVDTLMPWWVGLAPIDGAAATSAYDTVLETARAHATEVATSAAATLTEDMHVDRVVATGDVPSAILEDAAAWGADVIAVGTRGHGAVRRALLGSTSRYVLHHAPMSVLVVRNATVPKIPAADVDAA